jgi:sulfur transfer protein SufE
MITQALEKQRQEIVDQFEHVRKEKERENQIIADSIKNGAIGTQWS